MGEEPRFPFKVGDKAKLTIEGMALGGEGVGRYKGLVVFLPYGVPGDEVEVQITALKKNYARGLMAKIISPSSKRIDPVCPSFPECGGCDWLHIDYKGQLEYKTQLVIDALERIGGLKGTIVHNTLGAEQTFFYRNKVEYHLARGKGKILLGIYAKDSHRVVEVERCALQHPLINELISQIRGLLGEDNNLTKVLGHMVIRVGISTGEVMVILVTRRVTSDRQQATIKTLLLRLAEILRGKIRQMVGVIHNVIPPASRELLGGKVDLLWGRDYLLENLDGLKFHLSPKSFFQINTKQAEVLLRVVRNYGEVHKGKVILDAYSGVGTIGLSLAREALKVYGIEEIGEAVKDAWKNAQVNGITNCEFLEGKVEETLPKLVGEGRRFDLVVLDPPRGGCDSKALEGVVRAAPQSIIYVSCNPASLARDLKYLTQKGYRIVETQPLDMFPHTAHIECVVKVVKL